MRVRDDDVLLAGSRFTNEEALTRLKTVHEIIVKGGAIHIASIICETLDQFPELQRFLREQYENGTLIPEVHCWEHVDYQYLSQQAIEQDLARCIKAVNDVTGYTPTKFYVPWGGNSSILDAAASAVGLETRDTSRVLYPKWKTFRGKMREANSQAVISGERELFVHWWEDRWFGASETNSLADTLAIIREVAEKS
jgi:peptidoglycan/xylan/chitin deacetylase (PgdA/CDA1 family)